MSTRPSFVFSATILVASMFASATGSAAGPAVYPRGATIAVTPESPQPVAEVKQGYHGNFPAFASDAEFVKRDADRAVNETEDASHNAFAAPAITVTSSLAIVLGLFAALVWLARKYGSRSLAPGSIPNEVLQCLGSTALDPRTRVTMLRCGSRILVLAQTAAGVQPLCEITDPEEVRQLAATCLGDSKRAFEATLAALEKEKVSPGFTDHPQPQPSSPRSRGQLFATA